MNRLSKEKSPYLLQHADNPVDWFPWCEDAFEKAANRDKPIFLSIGYSTCHWCHVMEKESFEDEEIAYMMNNVFVSIKVDREERPDIDGVYMSVCQMLTGSGGWPLTIIMTPDKQPFFAGTYFPKDSRFGRPGMKEIISGIKDIWLNRRNEINKSASDIVNALNNNPASSAEKIKENIFDKAFIEFKERFDPEFGGFGSAPKFPSPHNLCFLLRYYKRSGSKEALRMVEQTLQQMSMGGIYDHIGYGYHRYSTDRKWLVPHFEKMLYDQAFLSIAYTELYQVTSEISYRQTAEEILEYVLRDMTSPDGGFYSAEDADSEGEEGKFYLWNLNEIENVLGKDAQFMAEIFNLKPEGNFSEPVNEEETANNIFHLSKSSIELSTAHNIPENILKNKIEYARKKLFDAREKRVHPYKDDKILTDWNALMISALARASRVFQNRIFKEAAVKAADFILNNLLDEEGKLLHRFRNGEAGITANLDDYAFTVAAFIDLYETTFDLRWLKYAIRLNDILLKHFHDDINGGFFFIPDDGEKLIVRQKEIYDGAIPSGNSVALLNLMKIGRITGNSNLEDKAFKIAGYFSDQINKMPSAFTQSLVGLEYAMGESLEIVIVGERNDKTAIEIMVYLSRAFIPNKIILLKEPSDTELKNIAPFTEQQIQIDGKTTVYICRHYTCEKPITSLEEVKALLD